MPNLFDPEFNQDSDRPGFSWRRAALGHQAGAERLGASLFALPPEQAAFPLHYHLGNEEMLIVIDGSPSLRTPDGERQLERGEVVAFLRGEAGAHQIVNRTESPIRVVMLSSMVGPEIVQYLDTGKIAATTAAGKHFMLARPGPTVEYWEGED